MKNARIVAAAAALVFAWIARSVPALADDAQGETTVYLKDGGIIRGKLVELRPNDHASIAMANGQTATISWDVIDHVENGSKPPPAPPPVANTPSPPPAPAPAAGTAMVHIQSDSPVRLERETGRRQFSFVCQSPCDQAVEVGGRYRISGDGVRATRVFELEAKAGQTLVIDVETSSKAGFALGIVVVSVAPVVSLVGVVLLAVNSVDGSEGGKTAGIGLAVGGLVGIAIGTIMIVTCSSSKQTQSLAQRATAVPPRDAMREPVWATPTVAPPLPAIFEAPVIRF